MCVMQSCRKKEVVNSVEMKKQALALMKTLRNCWRLRRREEGNKSSVDIHLDCGSTVDRRRMSVFMCILKNCTYF